MAGEKTIKYRYFFFSFAIAFLVLSLMFLALMTTVHPKTPQSLQQRTDALETAVYVPTQEDAITVLFMGVGGESEAGTFILARFDPVRGQVPVVVFPADTAVNNNGKTETLREVYKYGGADYTRNTLASTLNITIDRYVRVNVSNFVLAAAAVGTVEYALPYEVTLDSGGIPITLSRGNQLLDGQRVADLIRYGGYEGGELTRCQITAEITAAIVNQRIDVVQSTLVDKVFERVINLIDTDISFVDYDNRLDAALFLAQLGRDPAEAVPVSGSYNTEGTLFTLSDTFSARITQMFG